MKITVNVEVKPENVNSIVALASLLEKDPSRECLDVGELFRFWCAQLEEDIEATKREWWNTYDIYAGAQLLIDTIDKL